MTYYLLDTSVAMHALDGNPGAAQWFDATAGDPAHTIVASQLLRTEMTRTLIRDHRETSERREVLDFVELYAVDPVLAVAESLTGPIKTPDSIHLATALLIGAGTVVVTHDTRMAALAQGLGLETLDPVTDLPQEGRENPS